MQKPAGLLVAWILFACGAMLREDRSLGRVVGGDPVTDDNNDFKFLALLKFVREWSGPDHCGGSILSSRHVVSAAHCYRPPVVTKRSTVSSGKVNYNDPLQGRLQEVEMKKIFVQERFRYMPKINGSNIENDIMLVVLVRDLEFDNFTTYITLTRMEPVDGTKCDIAGFGYCKHQVQRVIGSKQLRRTTTVVHPRDVCKRTYWAMRMRSSICAWNVNETKEACQGDSGGPLVCDKQLAGLISYGSGCTNVSRPTMFTSVYYMKQWIMRKMSEL